MADRKVTVLNPAGYQEQLPDSDNLLLAAAPTANTHAVNKLYVDTGLSNLDVTLDLQDVTDVGNTTTNDITIGDISLNANGSASFIGPVTALGKVISGAVEIEPYTSSPGSFSLKAFNSSTPSIRLNQDGSAEFAGGVTEILSNGTVWAGRNDAQKYAWLNKAGFLVVTNVDTTATANGCIEIYKDGTNQSNRTLRINSDGSGEFAGKVNSGDWDGTGGSGVGSSLSFAGGLFARRAAGSNSEKLLFAGWNGLNQVAKIDAAGGAKFAGSILQGPEWDREVSQNQALISNGTFYARRAAPASPLFRGYAGTNPGDDSDLTIELFANGSATFAGDVTANKLIGDIDCGEY